MFRNWWRLQKFRYASLLVPISGNRDDTKVTQNVPSDSDLSGWDRIRIMFKKDEYDQLNPKIASIVHLIGSGMFVGGCYGGITASLNTYRDFIRKNTMTAFISNYNAQRKLQEAVFVTFFRKGTQYAVKFAIFIGMYSFVTTLVSTYRGHESILDYIAGATVAGSLYRVSLGLRGMVGGAFLGFLLGTFFGTLITLLERVFDLGIEDIQQSSHRFNASRAEAGRKQMKAATEAIRDKEFAGLYEHSVRSEQLDLKPDLETVE